jgi:antitoxin component YwqK of YwqJK toxin-antitoxin module
MKRILAPILLMTLLFPSIAYGETMDDLVKRDGIHYKKFSDVPFTGKVTGKTHVFLKNGQGSLKNGRFDGPWVYYHDNGQLLSKGTYKDGRKVGSWVSYHDNGQLAGIEPFKDGRGHGPYVTYYPNGQVWMKGTNKGGTIGFNGPSFVYWNNGQLMWKGTYKNGKQDGPWVGYNEDGTVWDAFTGTFKNDVKVK